MLLVLDRLCLSLISSAPADALQGSAMQHQSDTYFEVLIFLLILDFLKSEKGIFQTLIDSYRSEIRIILSENG